MPRRSNRLKQQELKETPPATTSICVIDVSSSDDDDDCGVATKHEIKTPTSPLASSPLNLDDDSPIKYDSSIQKLMDDWKRDRKQLEEDQMNAGDELTLESSEPSQNDNLTSIFIHHDTAFSYKPFDVDWDSADSLFGIFEELSKLLTAPISALRLLTVITKKSQTKGDSNSPEVVDLEESDNYEEDVIKVLPGRSLHEQNVSKDAVIFHCLDFQEEFGKTDFFEDVDEKDRLLLVIQRLVKRRAGLKTDTLEKVSISYPATQPIKFLLHFYCDKQKLSLTQCSLKIDGEQIDLEKNCLTLGLEDNDVIDCKVVE